ncbi:glycosyltransferase family 4 protein [Spirochaetia bacterium 38H-sp]|uniref:Glycosyltransferase family 4 protein n=1 Tax=Rarispira pelagica TaxID=3141764 RepID=A0ABU9U9W6_9SPIR
MKLLHVSTWDISGGAARAAYRLHKALLYEGIDSKMLVQDKKSDDYTVLGLANNKIQKTLNILRPIVDTLPVKFFYKNRTKTLFSPSWVGSGKIIDKIDEINPDIVHLHWICGGMLKIEDLAKIKKPIVWSLHDMWAFTGGCHYDEECEGYKKKCGYCKVLSSNISTDLSRKGWDRKRKVFEKMDNITIVGLSRWLMTCSKKSSLLQDKKHINLPNPIDTALYKPLDRLIARRIWNLPEDKKLVLFGAMNATSDPRKGFYQLGTALEKIDNKNLELVVFGSSKPKSAYDYGFYTHYVGQLYDDISLAALYSAVDVMIVPSLQEAFGLTAVEAMACGTPVVAFNATGLQDIVEHDYTGYLAQPYDTNDLAKGIDWILNLDEAGYNYMCKNAREKVLQEFDSRIVAKKYIELYKSILSGSI